MLASQAVAQSMIERRRGAIVNVVSIAGHTGGGPGAGVYAAAKAALTAYTKSLAKELAPHGVRVNAVSPGRHRHAVSRDVFHARDDAELRVDDSAGARRHGGRVRDGHRVSRLDAASYIVGETIEVNGGQLMR